LANTQLVEVIKVIHAESHQTYGSPRIHAELSARGHPCNRKRVARLMRLHGIQASGRQRRRVVTTDSRHDLTVAPNLLGQDFAAQAPDAKWVADITYVPTQAGWLYLAVVLDLYSRKVVGWSMDRSMTASLATHALRMALQTRRPASPLLHHSDRGGQYASYVYQELLRANAFHVSMSRRGNVYDNAVIESFFGSLKTELIYHHQFRTIQEAKTHIFAYIEGFYNHRRRHSSLGYLSPDEFERHHYQSA
jgi:transposase InsO family protein